MQAFEYKVVPAPAKGLKTKGIRTTQDRFAHTLEQTMNDLGAQGWEYQRTDTLPCEEREGLMGKTTAFQHMLVFRRPLAAAVAPTQDAQSRVEETLTAPTPPKQIEKQPDAVQSAAPALKQPPAIARPVANPDAPAVPTPAPRPNMAAE